MRAYKLPGGTVPAKTWDLYEKTGVWPDRPYVRRAQIPPFDSPNVVQANGACLGQYLLEAIFRKHLGRYGINVELDKGLVELTQTDDGVTAILAIHQNGTPTSERETVLAQYVIGADGARGMFLKRSL